MPDSIGWKLLAAAFAATMLSAAPAEAWPWIYAGPPIVVPPPVVVAPLAVSWGGRSPSEGLSMPVWHSNAARRPSTPSDMSCSMIRSQKGLLLCSRAENALGWEETPSAHGDCGLSA